jgi:hypothetical protein
MLMTCWGSGLVPGILSFPKPTPTMIRLAEGTVVVVHRRRHRVTGQRTGEVAVSGPVAVWNEDPGYRGGGAGAAGTR